MSLFKPLMTVGSYRVQGLCLSYTPGFVAKHYVGVMYVYARASVFLSIVTAQGESYAVFHPQRARHHNASMLKSRMNVLSGREKFH